jgi:hypothetical protein
MPIHRLHLPAVSRQRRLLGAGRKVPDLQCRVVGASDELGVCRCDGQPPHCLGVRLYLLDVVEVCLPVLDHARLVCREQPVVGVGVLDASNRRLVSLHNSLKVESHAVPQRELSARRSREQPPALWGPFHDVDGVLDFVQRRVNGFGGYGFGSAGDSGRWGCHVHQVAGTRALDLGHGGILISRAAVAHPLHCGGAIVGDGACRGQSQKRRMAIVVQVFATAQARAVHLMIVLAYKFEYVVGKRMFTYAWVVGAGRPRTGAGGIRGPWW